MKSFCFFCLVTVLLCQGCADQAGERGKIPDNSHAAHATQFRDEACSLARTLLEEKRANDEWTLSELDTTVFFTTEDYFTGRSERHRLVLIGGEAGMAAGNAHHLLMLLTCSDTPQVVWSGQTGPVMAEDIVDLDGDGVKEVILRTSSVWMGECNESFSVQSFLAGEVREWYVQHSFSLINCGGVFDGGIHALGDTLIQQFDFVFLPAQKGKLIRQVRTLGLYNGGEEEEEAQQRLRVISDTLIFHLY